MTSTSPMTPARTDELLRLAEEAVAWQFRQRSAVGKGPQISHPWCDWCGIEREDYERYLREPNKLVEVRALYAHSETGHAPSEVQSEGCKADFYALWCDECGVHPSKCPRRPATPAQASRTPAFEGMIANLIELDKQRSPGPWRKTHDNVTANHRVPRTPKGTTDVSLVARCDTDWSSFMVDMTKASKNARFIVALENAWPKILAALSVPSAQSNTPVNIGAYIDDNTEDL